MCSDYAIRSSPMKRLFTVAIWVSVGVLGLAVGCSRPNADYTDHSITLTEFTNRITSIILPVAATNIHYARSAVGLGGRALLYRFDAPLNDCLSHAQHLIEINHSEADRPEWHAPTNLVALSSPPHPIVRETLRPYGLSSIRWCDVESVRSGFRGRAGPSGRASFWVDTERERFYYFWTD